MSNDAVVIKMYSNEIEAAMAQQLLDKSGVRALTLKDDAGGMEPHLQRTTGVRLVINREDAKRACEILETLERS
jgi:hypothetical protein